MSLRFIRYSLLTFAAVCLACIAVSTISPTTHAATTPDDFSIQVTPSPLVATVKPGQQTTLELKVFNSGISPVNLKIETRSFGINNGTGEINIDDAAPAEVQDWISFDNDTFTVQPGQWYTQHVTISLPKETGFSYHFAIVISQNDTPKQTDSTRILRGSVAVFTLINVDRTGSVRKLEAIQLEADKQVYEYLPAKISVKFKNSGNSIVQPYGNIFIQRGSDDTKPIATLPVNEKKGYILPGSVRTLSTEWVSGFPRLVTDDDGKVHEEWDWSHISEFRFGKYTVKLVGVYNDGQRDVPIESEISFWVIPWKILLALLIVIILIGMGIWSLLRKVLSPVLQRTKRITPKHLGLHR